VPAIAGLPSAKTNSPGIRASKKPGEPHFGLTATAAGRPSKTARTPMLA